MKSLRQQISSSGESAGDVNQLLLQQVKELLDQEGKSKAQSEQFSKASWEGVSGVLGDLGIVLEDGEDVSPLAQPAGMARKFTKVGWMQHWCPMV